MLEISRTFVVRDPERGIEVIHQGGNADGDRHKRISGPDWWAEFTTNILFDRDPPVSAIRLRREHNVPFPRAELLKLIEECVALELAALLSTEPTNVIATFHPERLK